MPDIDEWLSSVTVSLASGSNGLFRGLPGRAYRDKDILAKEFSQWFENTWLFVGCAHEIPAPGDLLPIPYLRLFLARDEDNVVRAYHNVCRHRGHELVQSAIQGSRTITCPYHGWCYDLKGRLRSTTQFGGKAGEFATGFTPHKFGLMSVRCEQWHDWMFVNIDGNAPPLDKHLGALQGRLSKFDFSNLRHIHTLEHGEVKSNWKLIMENSLEPYHTPFVHKQTGAGIPLEDHLMINEDGILGCYIELPEKTTGAPAITDGGLSTDSYFLSVPPLLIFVVYDGTTIIVHRNIPHPERPDRTWRTVYLFTIAEDDFTDAELQEWKDITYKIHVEEDGPIYENLQLGKYSPVTEDGGILSPVWETAVHRFFSLWSGRLSRQNKDDS